MPDEHHGLEDASGGGACHRPSGVNELTKTYDDREEALEKLHEVALLCLAQAKRTHTVLLRDHSGDGR